MLSRLSNISRYFDTLMPYLAADFYRKLTRDTQIMHDYRNEIIEKYLQQQKSSAETSKWQSSLLDILKQQNMGSCDHKELRKLMDSMLLAGTDTTENAISFTLYEISRNAQVQRKLLEEIQNVMIGSADEVWQLAQLNKLSYMDCVIKESMRLHTPSVAVGRKTAESVKLSKLARKSLLLIIFI